MGRRRFRQRVIIVYIPAPPSCSRVELAIVGSPDRVLAEGVREVSLTNDSLAKCIGDGSVAMPELTDFNKWQAWRRDAGKRPKTLLGDSRATTTGEESTLWRATMQRLYGADWRADLQRKVEEAQVAAAEGDPEDDADDEERRSRRA